MHLVPIRRGYWLNQRRIVAEHGTSHRTLPSFLTRSPSTAAPAARLASVWKSTSVSGAPDKSSLSHISAMTRPSWLGRAARNRIPRHRAESSRRWRGGDCADSARTLPKILISTQVSVRLIPAPRGTGLVAAPASKKILAMAGLEVSSCVQQLMRPSAPAGQLFRGRRVDDAKRQLTTLCTQDCYSTTRGHSRTTGNFITAVFNAVSASYGYLSLELFPLYSKGALPRTHRLPRQGGRIGQGRRRVLGAHQETGGVQVASGPPPRAGRTTLAEYRVPACRRVVLTLIKKNARDA